MAKKTPPAASPTTEVAAGKYEAGTYECVRPCFLERYYYAGDPKILSEPSDDDALKFFKLVTPAKAKDPLE